MKRDESTQQIAFRKRQIELEKIIRQMKNDELHTSTVYRNLEQELNTVKTKLSTSPGNG